MVQREMAIWQRKKNIADWKLDPGQVFYSPWASVCSCKIRRGPLIVLSVLTIIPWFYLAILILS